MKSSPMDRWQRRRLAKRLSKLDLPRLLAVADRLDAELVAHGYTRKPTETPLEGIAACFGWSLKDVQAATKAAARGDFALAEKLRI